MLMDYMTLSKNLFGVSFASLLLSFAAGCAKGAPAPTATVKPPHSKVVFIDSYLKKDLKIEKVTGGRGPNQMLYAQAVLRNKGFDDAVVEIQTVYCDAKGNPLNPPGSDTDAWNTIVVPADGTLPYRSETISPLAQAFVIQIRDLK
jgi:hypothetical protein